MKTNLFHKLTAAVCALGLLLSLAPAALAAGASAVKLTADVMLAPPTFSETGAIKTDGSLWSYDVSQSGWNLVRDPVFRKADDVTGKSAGSWTRVDKNDSLWVWGYKTFLDGSDPDIYNMINVPVKIIDGVLYGDASLDGETLALKKDGTLWTWSTPSSAVKLMDNVVQAKNNGVSLTALKKDGTLWHGGFYEGGCEQVGEGYVAFSSNSDLAYYGIKADGSLWSWGRNKFAALGLGYATSASEGTDCYVFTPQKVMDDVVCVDAGVDRAFAVTSDGTLYAWGLNEEGWLGFSGGDITVQDSVSAKGLACQSKPRKLMDGVVMVRNGIVLKQDGTLWANRYDEGSRTCTGFKKIMDDVMLPSKGITVSAPAVPTTPAEPTTPASGQFSDVSAGYWAYDDIMTCAGSGIVTGLEGGRFDPEGKVTSVQLTVMLTRTFYASDLEGITAPAGAPWYYPYTKVAEDNGLNSYSTVVGEERTTAYISLGDEAIDRYDMAQILCNIIARNGKQLSAADPRFASAAGSIKDFKNVSYTHSTAVQQCYGLGIITGMSDGCFHGEQTMTRAQACVILQRMIKLING